MLCRVPTASSSGVAAAVRLAGATVASGILLFLLAGTTAWPAAWAYLAGVTLVLGAYSAILAIRHPDLIDERRHPPADAKRWDKPFVVVVGGLGPLVLLVVCALDHRFGWSPHASPLTTFIGLLMVATGGSFTAWAVAHNRYFSAFVRIQRDRGHRVVDTGPYRLVRHPGYAGSLLHMFGTALALGSLWAVPVAAIVSLVLAVRTALEDRTLHAELEGYAHYARRVRFRLVPGLW